MSKRHTPLVTRNVFNPEKQVQRIVADKLALEESKKRDLANDWGINKTSLAGIEKKFNYPVKSWLMHQSKKRRRVISVLDLGCGEGTLGRDLRFFGGKKLRVVGSTVKKSKKNLYHNYDKIYEGDFSELQLKESFDCIISNCGGTFHTKQVTKMVSKVIDSLRVGGVAIVNFNRKEISIAELVELLNQSGLKPNLNYRFSPNCNQLIIMKTKKHLPK
ncbi:MAG: class I SAM-dependent methyltransferase [Candidatus ainarchaeum sp.]|nr:class I SAM-dependent methyltransferase [Candidatus ainarchaeum sp.]